MSKVSTATFAIPERPRRARSHSKARPSFLMLPLLVFALSAGCSSNKPPEAAEPCDKQVVTAAILATEIINPEVTGEARPVQMRLYQLKNDVAFRNLSFDQIWKEDEAKLGGDIMGREEFALYPNSRKEVAFERNPEAEYIVAAGLFRSPKGKQWFSTFELPPPPGKEACGAKCTDGKCESADLNPKVYVRVDGTRVEDGSAYASEFLSSERVEL